MDKFQKAEYSAIESQVFDMRFTEKGSQPLTLGERFVKTQRSSTLEAKTKFDTKPSSEEMWKRINEHPIVRCDVTSPDVPAVDIGTKFENQ